MVRASGDTLKDTGLVMEVADDDLVNIVNSQNHQNKEVIGVVRKWVGLLLKHNIHRVARRVLDNFNLPTSCFPYVQVPTPNGVQPDLMDTYFRVLSRIGCGIEVNGGNTVGQLLGRKFEENI